MIKHVLAWASFMTLMTAGSIDAQQPTTKDQGIKPALQQKVQIPGANYEFVFGSVEFSPGGNASIEALLTAIVTWISDNFDLPAAYDHPRIVTMSSVEMTNNLYQSFLRDPRGEMSVPENQGQSDQRRQVRSLYNVASKTIYLPPEWTGRTPAELSVLVHEMVHHLQNVAHIAYNCPQARESVAYDAQEKWLNLFERSLSSEFELDRFTLLLATSCME